MSETLELLRQAGREAAEKAGDSLFELMRRDIVLKPSFADICSIHEIHRRIYLQVEKVGIMIFARLNGVLEGELIFVVEEKNAYNLVNLAQIGKVSSELGQVTEMGVSVLKETGNIIIGSYLTAWSARLKRKVEVPLSIFLSGPLDRIFLDVIYHPYPPMKQAQRYLIQTSFEAPGESLKGNLSLALAPEAAETAVAVITAGRD